jgi:molybdenum-dependent DNA-binding transcriptional regulator ModE
MLSHHQISTLLLIQRSPYHLESIGHEIAALQHEKLVEIDRPASGVPSARLTSRGREVLRRLDKFGRTQARHVESMEEMHDDDSEDL